MVGTSGIAVWAEGIKADLKQRLPGQRKTQRDKLSLLVATMLHVRSANLVELASGLPRPSDRWDMGYQWRLLSGSGVVALAGLWCGVWCASSEPARARRFRYYGCI